MSELGSQDMVLTDYTSTTQFLAPSLQEYRGERIPQRDRNSAANLR